MAETFVTLRDRLTDARACLERGATDPRPARAAVAGAAREPAVAIGMARPCPPRDEAAEGGMGSGADIQAVLAPRSAPRAGAGLLASLIASEARAIAACDAAGERVARDPTATAALDDGRARLGSVRGAPRSAGDGRARRAGGRRGPAQSEPGRAVGC